MKIRTAIAPALALTAGIALAGCSGSEPTISDHSSHGDEQTPAPAANDADIMFATMMIAHHQQAVDMSDTVLAKNGVDPRVAELAEEIASAQGPEIEQMRKWLDEWGAEVDDTGASHHHGDGMMTEEDLTELAEADGPDASRLFLEQMIVHHEGAVDMAETQVSDGENPDAVALAQSIIDTQTAEIEQMRGLLDAL